MIINIQLVEPSDKYTEAQLDFARKFHQWLELNYKDHDILDIQFSSLPYAPIRENVSFDPYSELVFNKSK